MNVAATGSSGLLGRWLGARPLARSSPWDLEGVDVVFHLAAQTVVSEARADPLATYEANVTGTWRLLGACAEAGVRRLVLASTDQVYGPSPERPVTEDRPIAPEGPYAASKAAAELVAREFPAGPEIVVARLVNLYGGGDAHATRLVPGTVGAILAGRRPVIRGDGSAARDLLYVEDAVSALRVLAGAPAGTYNVGSGKATSVRDVVQTALRVAGSDLRPDVLGETPPNEGGDRAVDASRLRALGWAPEVDLAEGLARTLAWYREHAGTAV